MEEVLGHQCPGQLAHGNVSSHKNLNSFALYAVLFLAIHVGKGKYFLMVRLRFFKVSGSGKFTQSADKRHKSSQREPPRTGYFAHLPGGTVPLVGHEPRTDTGYHYEDRAER